MTIFRSDEMTPLRLAIALVAMPAFGVFALYALATARLTSRIWTRGRYVTAEGDPLHYWGLRQVE